MYYDLFTATRWYDLHLSRIQVGQVGRAVSPNVVRDADRSHCLPHLALRVGNTTGFILLQRMFIHRSVIHRSATPLI